jgi:hypothetical protein
MWHNLVALIGWLKKKNVWQNNLKNSNDAMCHILRLPHVNIPVCIVVASVVERIHPWICIKFSYLYSMKK